MGKPGYGVEQTRRRNQRVLSSNEGITSAPTNHDKAKPPGIKEREMKRLTIQMPGQFLHERRYILRELLTDVRGVEWAEEVGPYSATVITDTFGRKLSLQEELFAGDPTLPWSHYQRRQGRIHLVAIQDPELERAVGHADLPVLFGKSTEPLIRVDPDGCLLVAADLLGGAFWMLTRMEELDNGLTDSHGRYPAEHQWIVASGLELRPVVDEYRAFLNKCIQMLWPEVAVRIPPYRLLLSHDMDHPTSRSLGVRGFLRQIGKDLIHRKSTLLAARRLLTGLCFPCHEQIDPGAGLAFLFHIATSFGLSPTFYWMVPEGASAFDGRYPLSSGASFRMLERCLGAGYTVGIHPGYDTFRSPELLQRQTRALTQTLRRLRAPFYSLGGRQHYLRWRPETWAHYCSAGLRADASIGFAERVGFRSGTARSYSAFDLAKRTPLDLTVEPLHAMNNALVERWGAGETPDWVVRIATMVRSIRHFGGDFSLLWHNDALSSKVERDLFVRTLEHVH